ncbi:MAG: transglycosylase family protein [Acidimicrobiia bacterium]
MRKRTLLIVAPLCVVALAAGVAVAAPSSRASASDPRLDNPNAVRPIAASASALELNALGAMFDQVVAYALDVQLHELVAFLDGLAADEAAARAQLTVTRPFTPASVGNGDFLSCVKQRESGGDYTIHNTGGSGASGAYQFMPGAWNSIAGSVGRDDLVGTDPAAALPADQDAMAAALYAQRGAGPWGGGC